MFLNKFFIVAVCHLLLGSVCAMAATNYFVALTGNNSNPGTYASPFRTIQKAATVAQAGDVITVRDGAYSERVTTARGGSNAASRIKFQADGIVSMRGWVVAHPFVTVEGFDITGHSAASITEGFVKLESGANRFELLNCRIRDGIALKRDNMVFTAPNQISSATGGFLAAGFFPGQTIALRRATNVTLSTPLSTFVISNVTDDTITVTQTNIVSQGPVPAYITGSYAFALNFQSTTEHAVIRGNVFSNLSHTYMLILGSNHLFEANTITHNNGWDAMVLGGTDHRFIRNSFHNFGWGNYSPSPDIIDNFGSTKFERITFSNNFIHNIVGVISVQKSTTSVVSGPLLLTHNVFADIGFFWGQFPNTRMEHNTFLRVSRQSNPAVQVERHAVIFDTQNYATNAVIRNNVFVDCGQATGSFSSNEVGWYRFVGPTNSVLVEGNFVAGSAPSFNSKVGWPEGNPLLNGGNPGFVNMSDLLGPDGLPFSEDDGLRLLASSKLIGAGANGRTPGAYEIPLGSRPALAAEIISGNQFRISWPETAEIWTLQSSATVPGAWSNVSTTPFLSNGTYNVVWGTTNHAGYFRLTR